MSNPAAGFFRKPGPDQLAGVCVEHALFRCSPCAFLEISRLEKNIILYERLAESVRVEFPAHDALPAPSKGCFANCARCDMAGTAYAIADIDKELKK